MWPNSRRSPETFAVASGITGVLLAAVLTLVPSLAFGTFWRMAAVLVGADLVVYVAMKVCWLKMRGGTE